MCDFKRTLMTRAVVVFDNNCFDQRNRRTYVIIIYCECFRLVQWFSHGGEFRMMLCGEELNFGGRGSE